MVEEDLEPLITRCPNCSTQFRVTESQLAAAGGRVRCGACLTVFEGTEHLILDEDSTFSDGVEADAALDALLDELGSEGVEAGQLAPDAAADGEAASEDSPVIYGGFEDEAVADLNGDAPEQTIGAAASPDEPDVEQPEALAELDDGSLDEQTDEPADEDPDERTVEHRAEEDAAPVAGPETEEPEAAKAPEQDADYAAWIRPGTPDIEQMVDEVVASGPVPAEIPAEDLPPEEAPPEEAAAAVAETADGFHLSAVEKALEEEGVATQPISFAPEPRRWWVGGVAAVLGLALLAQIFYLQLPQWSRDPDTRGFYEMACGLLGCELPEIRALAGLRTRNLMVRSHPELANALVIDAVIVNQAGFAQRFPGLELKFTSVGGLLVAGRTFQPDEYLSGEIGAGDLMPVNTPVQVSLEIADPGEEAVNYTLSFR